MKVYKIYYNDENNHIIVKNIKDVAETISNGQPGDEYEVKIVEMEQSEYELLPEFEEF